MDRNLVAILLAIGFLLGAGLFYTICNSSNNIWVIKGREQILNQEYVCKRTPMLKDGTVSWNCKSVEEIKEALKYVSRVETR